MGELRRLVDKLLRDGRDIDEVLRTIADYIDETEREIFREVEHLKGVAMGEKEGC